MRYAILLILVLLVAACTPATTSDNMHSMDSMENMESYDEHSDMETHMGCQEQEMQTGCNMAEEGERNLDLFENLASVDVATEDVAYTEGYTGFLAYPNAEGQYPAVVMIHEWWGLNDNIKDMARLLANEGYVVLAVDLYGSVGETPDEARVLATAVRENPEPAIQNMKDAVAFLKAREDTTEKIGSMGWCFGGQQSLNLALNEEMDATVIYYGSVIDDKEQLSVINWPVLGVFGAEDTSISVESVNNFEAALNELGVENDINIYEGVGHAFANPSGSRYAAEETLDAWDKTVSFFNTNLG